MTDPTQPEALRDFAAVAAEEERLRALYELDLLDTRRERAFDQLVAFASSLFETPIALISLIDSHRQWFKGRLGFPYAETPRSVAFCDHTIRGSGVFVVEDATRNPIFCRNPLVTGEPHIRFYAGAPLTRRGGQNIGSLCVIDRRARTFSNHDAELLASLADMVVTLAEGRVRKRRLLRRVARLQILGRSERLRSDFLSHVSHELRTPMHVILSHVHSGLKITSKGGTWNAEKHLASIHTAGKRLLNLLNDLLDLQKLESGKAAFCFERGDLAEVCETAQSELSPLLSFKNLSLALVVETDNAQTLFDRNGLLQVIVNLLANAIKYSPQSGVITIVLSDATAPHHCAPGIMCAISDEGIGIPNDELESIFDKYAQGTNAKTLGGTGLGLSICRTIVSAHGGRIWAENGRGRGAVIKFVLPRAV
ncbi:GAF domain-containing sensor histidine kinase [Rhodomicrobium vannielii]|nr:GAF domain-containing sensor histidine kinase [Rhodomicrobium vannielii]